MNVACSLSLQNDLIVFLRNLNGPFDTPESRKNLVSSAGGVDLYGLIEWMGKNDDFLSSLFGVMPVKGQKAFNDFLNKLQSSPFLNLGDDDTQELSKLCLTATGLSATEWARQFPVGNDIRRRWEATRATSQADAIAKRLEQRRNRIARLPRQAAALLEDRVVHDFDLVPQQGAYVPQLAQASNPRIIAFATSGSIDFLWQYLIRRIEHFMVQDMGRAPVTVRIGLTETHLGMTDGALLAIDTELKHDFSGKDLANLVGPGGTDCFLVIWNHSVEPEKAGDVARFMACLWQEVNEQIAPLVHRNGRYLIILWADLDTSQPVAQSTFCILPRVIPKHVEDADAPAWLGRSLRCAGMTEDVVNDSVGYLREQMRRCGNDPLKVYEALREVVHHLKQGRIPCLTQEN